MTENCYICLAATASCGGPYAAIYDLSAATETTIPTEIIRSFARRNPSVPMGRPHAVVGTAPAIYELARIFQMCSEAVGKEFEVVHTLQKAYDFVGVRPKDFTERLFPKQMAA